MLDNPYYLQVLHITEYRLRLGNPIQDIQRDIPLGESRMRLSL